MATPSLREAALTAACADRPRCAAFTLAVGEDPIGTAPSFEHYIVVEVPTPWRPNVWQSRHVPAGVAEAWERGRSMGVDFKPLAIAPDPEYSRPGLTRVLRFRRPAEAFAVCQRDDFLVPRGRVAALIDALFRDAAGDVERFEAYRARDAAARELLVCTHGSEDACCGTFGFPLYRRLRERYAAPSQGRMRAWRVSHIGGHRFAPTVLDFPAARCWAHLDEAALHQIVCRDGPPEALRRHYRGWGGLDFFGQLVEREIFLREGWAWTEVLKTARLLTIDGHPTCAFAPELDPVFGEYPPRRIDLRIDWTAPESRGSGAYEATVELSGRLRGLGECGHDFWQRNTYRVARLVTAGGRRWSAV